MYLYYFKIALRNILKNPGYSVINIAGLAIGMACSLMILLWVTHELSYDRFHENADNIYRVVQEVHFTDHTTTWAITQGPLGPHLKEDFPEVISYTRFAINEFLLTYGDKSFDETVVLADGSMFEMFSLPLISGDPTKALSSPSSIVLSKAAVEKYFGSTDPVGKIIVADHQYEFTVTGVLQPIPGISIFHGAEFFIPFVYGRELDGRKGHFPVDRWNSSSFHTMIQLARGTPAQKFEEKISLYLKTRPTIEKDSRLLLQPFIRIHLYSDYEFDVSTGIVNIETIIFFSIVAVFILVIACINFMNLATARSTNRAREVGIRKISGALKTDITRQFLGESILHAFISLLIALVIIEVMLPVFNQLTDKQLSLNLLANYKIILGLLAITLVTGLISGSYPALALASLQPLTVFRGGLQLGPRGAMLRKILITFTFVFAIAMIICTITLYSQLKYMQTKNLGYQKEDMVVIKIQGDLLREFESVKKELLANADILALTASSGVPGVWGHQFSHSLWQWPGQRPDEEILMRVEFVHDNYFESFGMKIIKGHNFSINGETDLKNTVILNETAVKALRLQAPIGKQISSGHDKFTIVGVVKDYHIRSLHQKIDPLILFYRPSRCRSMFVRIRSQHNDDVIKHIERIFKKYAPRFPFDYRFMNERLNELYTWERQTGQTISYFAVLTIIIACVGLFGLSSYTAEQRTKEIGIRKAMGASVLQIVTMLVMEFVRCIVIANIFAWPIAYFVTNDWIEDYAYRISLSPWPFLFAAVLTLAIGLLTVIYQAVKAAVANPAQALRYE
jgi:ABC-type antimicrobial peptide transport system permease subunit